MKPILIIGNYHKNAMYHPFDGIDKDLSAMFSSYDVECTDDTAKLLDAKNYSCVISYWDNWNIPIPREAANALKSYVKEGGSLFAIHNGISFDLWEDLREMIGAFFITHPAQEEITFLMESDSLTEGVSEFSLVEEPYQFDMVDDDKKLIMTYRYRDQIYPAGWKKSYGKGKVVYLTPGHTREKFTNSEYIKLIQNCVNWCVTQ